MLVRLADWCYRRRRLVVVAWIVALVGAFALAGAFGGELQQDYLQPGSESKAASDTLEERFPQQAGDTVQIVVHSDAGVTSPEVRAQAEKIFDRRRRQRPRRGRGQPLRRGGRHQISEDGTTAYAEVALDKRDSDFTPEEAKALVEPILAAGDDTLQVEVGGPVAALSQTRPVRNGRHRAHRRGHHPAVHLRVRGGDGAAADHRPVRPRHRDRARGGPAPRGRRPGLGPAHGGDGRPRCRHRLRAAHRHPVPQQPRRRAGAAASHGQRDRDGRSRRACSPASSSSSRCSASCWSACRP